MTAVVFELSPAPVERPTYEATAEEKRREANYRPRCDCGRFAKHGRGVRQDWQGDYSWSVVCSEHGEVWQG